MVKKIVLASKKDDSEKENPEKERHHSDFPNENE